MYERSAVILERYFAEKFYYNGKNNLKNNYNNYCDLIEQLEKYQEVSNEEDEIIKTCEDIVNKLKQVQKEQSTLYRKAVKLQEDRNILFENIDESAENIEKQLNKIERDIDKNSEEMKPVDIEFTNTIREFNKKSKIRSECGKDRRKVEKEYRSILEITVDNFQKLDKEKVKEIKKFLASEDDGINEELKNKMFKNGENEKIPFDSEVLEKSIILGQEVHKREAQLLIEIYEKSNSVLNEINSNTVKVEKYKKIAKKVTSKLEFIKAQKEYLIQFLDNERLSVSLGKQEHKKMMKEACKDMEQDLEQINRLYELLIKETEGKATQKMYKELYNDEYLRDLKQKEKEFDENVSKLNLIGKIINPIYWRIDGIKKIYAVFDEIVTQEYERDLSKFKEKDEELDDEENEKKKQNKDLSKEAEEINSQYYDEEDEDYKDEDLDEEEKWDEEIEDDEEGWNDETNEDELDDWEDEEYYEDIDTILKKRKEKIKKKKNGKKGGLFGKFVSY